MGWAQTRWAFFRMDWAQTGLRTARVIIFICWVSPMALLHPIPSPSSSSLRHQPPINTASSSNPNFNLRSRPPPQSQPFLSRRSHRFGSLRCLASSDSRNPLKSDDVIELPLFPLPLVLFPGSILPLQIFEFRYRIMMHTLLQSDLRFGILYSDPASGAADVGCVGEIIKYERLVDDRFILICKGQERFRVNSIVRTKPYLVAQVNWLEDRPSGNEDLEKLASEVDGLMKDVIRISNRLDGKPEKEAKEQRRKQYPTPFSFFVGSTFEAAPKEQQVLLEMEDTAARLKREKETLRNTLNYLTATAALKDVFPSSSSEM